MTKFIAFVSGKGGVGKTTATLNVGQALADYGKRVILMDANLVTPNLALHLGMMNPEGTINKFIKKEKGFNEVMYDHSCGFSIIPASPSLDEFLNTEPELISKAFKQLDEAADFVLVDSPSGLGHEVNEVLKNTDEIIVVVNPNLSSVMDALKTIKLAEANDKVIAGVILNMTNRGRHELSQLEVEEILNYPILANVRNNRKARKSLHQNLPMTYLYPRSRPAKEYYKVAHYLTMEETV
ncbi:MAG: P-loop NTPase [Candidatus Kariarchaeaceae archaeon]